MNKNYLIPILLAVMLFSGCMDSGNAPAGGLANHPESTIPTTHPIAASSSTSSSTAASSSSSTTTEPAPTTTTSSSSSTSSTSTTTTTSTTIPKEEDRVEVVMFYPPTPCDNCIRVGDLAQETIETYYLNEIDSGKLTFRQVSLVDPQERDVVKKYGALSSSLWMGTYVNGSFYREIKLGVWYRTSNREEYISYLRGYIDKRLKGDLS